MRNLIHVQGHPRPGPAVTDVVVLRSNKTVALTLWGAAAEGAGADLEATAAAGPVVSISHCRVSDYNGVPMPDEMQDNMLGTGMQRLWRPGFDGVAADLEAPAAAAGLRPASPAAASATTMVCSCWSTGRVGQRAVHGDKANPSNSFEQHLCSKSHSHMLAASC